MSAAPRSSWLDRIERAGNTLPDPATLFLLGALLVMGLSQLAVSFEWSAAKTVADAVTGDRTQVWVRPTSLLSADGLYWALDSMVTSFVEFPPLGVVLVGMLGIGVAERSGLIGAVLKRMMLAVPPGLLTPTMVFTGVLSSVGLDAGYVVMPPVAAALYQSAGRSPLVGLAAVFAGVAAGFGANLVVTSLDPLLAGLSTEGARVLDPGYSVAATANLWFMIASTILLTGAGWAVTSLWVEPRFASKPAEAGGPSPAAPEAVEVGLQSADEARGMRWALLTAVFGALVLLLARFVPGGPLAGDDGPFPRWVAAIVPLLFVGFLLPGIAYGAATGAIKNDRDVSRMMGESMAGMGPYIVMAFFAAQFIAYFRYSGLGEILALQGGALLASLQLGAGPLMIGFIFVVAIGNLFIGSMSAKYAFFAPVFVPMFMQVGISPELTQVAYRIGDSISNVITPLNPYMVIILVFIQRYSAGAGLGTIVALMLPYTIGFAVAWSLLLLVWLSLGVPLGPAGPLEYTGAAALPRPGF